MNYTERLNKFTWATFEIIAICYYAIVLKEEKKKRKKWPVKKRL